MKKIIALSAVFVLLLVSAGYLMAAMEMKASTWTGEIIDVTCHTAKGAAGEDHAKSCGSACVKNGLPVGLLVDGTTYILVGEHEKPLNAELAEHVGHKVTVTGQKFESPGANVIVVTKFAMATM
jgi:hypothetical protein